MTGAGLAVLIAACTADAGNVGAVTAGPVGRCAIVALKAIKVGSQPAAMAITPGGKKGYVANANSGVVTPIRIATNTALRPVRFAAPGNGR
jgi:DNA-binding beta-propeller fold protein YncE